MKRWAVVLLVLLLVVGAFLFGPRLLRAVGADLGGFSGGGDYGGGDSGCQQAACHEQVSHRFT